MKCNTSLLLLLLLGITSCVTSYKINSINVEMIKPPTLPDTEKINTIVLFSRDMIGMDTMTFQYFSRNQPVKDSTFHYIENYNTCLKALAEMLVSEGSFVKVINCRDSLNAFIRTADTTLYATLFNKFNADALVFLDRYKLNDFQYRKGDMGTKEITGDFNEFTKSTWLANIWGSLLWTVRIKGDTTRYEFLQMDDLYYGDAVYPQFFGNRDKHQMMLDNTSIYFGKQFSEKLIPSWQQAERIYYVSMDSSMRKGALYCKKGEWLKAAEAYKSLVNDKNHRISSKAAYNMAVVCEMSGEMEPALDWLIRSVSSCPPHDTAHKDICKEYLQILQERRKELKQLDKLSASSPLRP